MKSYIAKTSSGPEIDFNEDGFEADNALGFYTVYDGFGGKGVTDVLINPLSENLKKFYTRLHQDPEATLPFFHSPRFTLEGNALVNALHYAQKWLCQENAKRPMDQRSGFALCAAGLSEEVLTIVSLGNCKSLLLRGGELSSITNEENFSHLYPGSGPLMKNLSSNGLGLFDYLSFQVEECRPSEGDVILLLTDGAYSQLNPYDITQAFSQSELTQDEQVEKLFDLNNQRGNQDNQTALALFF